MNDSVTILTSAQAELVSCHSCRLLCTPPANAVSRMKCPRCGAAVYARKPHSVARTWAFILTAIIFYIPSNILPVLRTSYLGATQSDTIISGVIYFVNSGSWHIALIIFTASIVVPVVKLTVLIFLLISLQRRSMWLPSSRAFLYRVTKLIGRWSMVDVYVVSVMVALLNAGVLINVQAGPGIIFFGAVVVTTLFATDSFDPRLMWDVLEQQP